MATKREPFRQAITVLADAGGVATVYYPADRELRTNEEMHITRVCAYDDTSAGATCDVNVETPGGVIKVERFSLAAASTVYDLLYELVLTTGQRLRADFAGATAADVLTLVVDGYNLRREV